ncbi:hypothetical protein EV189_1722 [Motilibacter rhizosphaerae]|uniref:Uncharacterized protein n=1 Tax=Motilibacter rhizosphaerae TaxID=598652 RepID=A0A4Q7NU62_9ACTN|nr:hypothetical protein [Motilibacter rhizosphaerae]RZS89942.1 hypothetical protein EV189_1722 [Motilibacter rhizosphaerae]
MSDYIDFSALGQVLLASVVLGAGLVALFAVGLVGVSAARGETVSSDGSLGVHRGSPLGYVLAAVCFAVVLAGIGLGIWSILAK